MKIKITANQSPVAGDGDISKFIGGIYEAVPHLSGNRCMTVNFGRTEDMKLYPNEYEIIDIQKEVKEFVYKYYECNRDAVEYANVSNFILKNRIRLLNLLK